MPQTDRTERKERFTPGPWGVSSDGIIYTAATDMPLELGFVAQGSDGVPEAEHNGALMSSSPDLYRALKILYEETADYITVNNLGDVHHNRSMQLARAALSKARGETPQGGANA